MSLAPGSRHGIFEITAQIGEGGMGQVYRARDTKLGREVAIKVISDPLVTPERAARFDREARTLASLNHPNIAAIYGLEDSGGERAIVMELVEGATLADRLALGPIPTAEAIAVVTQIAEALEAAHEQGIIHRDLKPANVKVRPDGTVKVLDFGLAKALELTSVSNSHSISPTLTSPAMTQAGMVLGTAAYMSPEQVKGHAVDKRCDVWAFGCVLYEMLTGHRAFAGSSVPETLANVLRSDVDWRLLPSDISPSIRGFLASCLVRDAKHRLHDIADMRLALQGAFEVSAQRPEAVSPPAQSAWWRRALAVAAIVVASAAITGVVMWETRPTAPEVVSRLRMALPTGQPFYFSGRHLVAISPDGRFVAYTAGLGLWIHPLDQLEATPVPGAETEARSPFFSPDSQSIGYYAAGELKRVSVTGGAPVTLTKAVNPWGARWGDDDAIYYGQGPDGIWRVPATGGKAERIVAVNAGEIAQSPQLMPGGDWLLFTLLPKGIGAWNRAKIVLHSLRTGERVTLIDGGSDARYLPTGHLVYALNGVLLAAPFDLDGRRLTGSAVPVIEGVLDAATITGATHFDLASNGSLVYAPRVDMALRLTWVDRNGREQTVPADPRPYRHPRISPDGTRIVVEVEDPGNTDVWIGNVRTGAFTRLTREPDVDSDPIWTPDGTRIVFSSNRGTPGLFSQASDGSGIAARITEGAGSVRAHSWTADGRVVFEELAGSNIQVIRPDGRAKPEAITLFEAPEYFNEMLPQVSPDGKWLAYQSTESGEMEVYVRPFPNVSGGRRQISVGGGFAPLWSRDGREIFYRSATSVLAVEVQSAPRFEAGTPSVLFGLGDYVLAGPRGMRYDVAPDGRFLLLKNEQGNAESLHIVLVQHWFNELRRLVPAK
jgi:eukaryotic-like serine/threonine-protein kinase